MDEPTKVSLDERAAQVYEEFFVPALFDQWAPYVADAAALVPGERVLDVACGTGVLAREAAARVAPGGRVSGLDVSEGMLAVARRKDPGIDWRLGPAEMLPFPDAEFDVVLSQFGLMFFDDRPAALREAWRVLHPGGRLAVAVWDSLERTPAYVTVVGLVEKISSPEAASALRAPFILGDTDGLKGLFAEASIDPVTVSSRESSGRFPSIESWISTDVRGWLAGLVNDEQYEALLREAERVLQEYVIEDGSVAFPMRGHIVSAVKA